MGSEWFKVPVRGIQEVVHNNWSDYVQVYTYTGDKWMAKICMPCSITKVKAEELNRMEKEYPND